MEELQESVKGTGITERETRVVEKKNETKRIKAFMYVAGMIDDIPFKKMLIDMASDCNMVSLATVMQHGLPYKNSVVTGVMGFNSRIYDDVVGEMTVKLSFGSTGRRSKNVIFYVVPDCPSPLIGLPTLEDFRITIDVPGRNIVEQETGEIIHCSQAGLQKIIEKEKEKRKKEEQGMDLEGKSPDQKN